MESEKQIVQDTGDQKGWVAGRRKDILDRVGWALVIIWAGVVLLLNNIGFFDSLGIDFLSRMDSWEMIFAGAGLLVLALMVVRMVVPDFRNPETGQIIFGFILLGIGIGDFVGWEIIGALILIGLGIGQLLKQGR
jgi:hypothetical protein